MLSVNAIRINIVKFESKVYDIIMFRYIFFFFFFAVAPRPNAGHGLLILEVSRSHTTTQHSR